MAVQFMDNFKMYNGDGNKMLDGLPWAGFYGGNVLGLDPDPGSSGYVAKIENWLNLSVPTPGQQVGFGFRLWMDNLPATGRQPQWNFCSGAGTPFYCLCVAPNGALELHRGIDISGTLVATTTSPVLSPHSWFHIECFIDTSTGAYDVRIEGVSVLSGTDSSHPTTSTGMITWTSQGVSITFYIKDVIVWDKTGSVNNNFLGSVTIYNLPVNSDISSGWTKSTGTSDYQLLDEGDGTYVDDTDYISAGFGPLPAPSIMGMTDLPANIVTVNALQTVVRAKKSDGGTATMQVSLKSGSSTGSGSAKAVTTSFKYWYDIQQLDPATGALWSPIAVNAAQLKIDRTV